MTKTRIILISAIAAAVLAVGLFLASNGASDSTLHFTSGDMSAAQYHTKVAAGFDYLTAHGYSVDGVCAAYRSLSADALDHTVSSNDPATRQHAVAILFQVCGERGFK